MDESYFNTSHKHYPHNALPLCYQIDLFLFVSRGLEPLRRRTRFRRIGHRRIRRRWRYYNYFFLNFIVIDDARSFRFSHSALQRLLFPHRRGVFSSAAFQTSKGSSSRDVPAGFVAIYHSGAAFYSQDRQRGIRRSVGFGAWLVVVVTGESCRVYIELHLATLSEA